MKKVLPFLYFVFLLFGLSLPVKAQVKINSPVNFTITDTDGQQHTLFDYLDAGKYVLIDFYFTTCGACNTAMPSLNEAYKRFGCNQADIVFIAINRGNTDAQVITHRQIYGGYFPSSSGINGQADDVVTAYGVTAFPTISLIAPNRSFISKDIYPVIQSNLDKAIHFEAGLPFQTGSCDVPNRHHLLRKKAELSLYPNPVINTASVQVNLIHAMDVQVKIINVLGQTVQTPIDSLLTEPTTRIIDFGKYRPGIYFIQLITNGQVVSTQRFSKIAP